MKTFFAIILLLWLSACSKNEVSTGTTAFNMTITGLATGPLHFSDYSDPDSAGEYRINGRNNYFSTHPVCWLQPDSGYFTFYFFDYVLTDTGIVISEVSFGMPSFSTLTIENDSAQSRMIPNIISGRRTGPHFTFNQMTISLTVNPVMQSKADGSFDVTGSNGIQNVHITGSFRGVQSVK